VAPMHTTHRQTDDLAGWLEQHRPELNAYCCRMLASPFEAEDAVQETFIRAWRGFDRFEGRVSLRSWLYRIATNICLDMLNGRQRRALPMDVQPVEALEAENRAWTKVVWRGPSSENALAPDRDPAELAAARETIRLAFITALQYLPPRQRAVLVLRDVLRWKATETARLLDATVASVNSALQRARATLGTVGAASSDSSVEIDDAKRTLLERYVEAFEAYDIDGLVSLVKAEGVGHENELTGGRAPLRPFAGAPRRRVIT
jgi:RNA polymerase sigma-70 factor, ECF subfamily